MDRSIYCSCCGKEKLAEIRDGKLVILAKRHGQKHTAVIESTVFVAATTLTVSREYAQ